MPDDRGAADSEPDYRYTLANERTFLAWMRTCLALLAGAVAVVQFAPDLGSETFRLLCSLLLAALAAGTAAGGLVRWLQTQRVMRNQGSLTAGRLPVLLAAGLAVVAVAVLGVLVVQLGR